MELLKKVIVGVMLLAWLPASSHCLLESAGFLPTDECCQETERQHTGGHQCSDGCASLEDSLYKTQEHAISDLAPVFVVIDLPVTEPLLPLAPMDSGWPPMTLDLQPYLITTSLPIRGPSELS